MLSLLSRMVQQLAHAITDHYRKGPPDQRESGGYRRLTIPMDGKKERPPKTSGGGSFIKAIVPQDVNAAASARRVASAPSRAVSTAGRVQCAGLGAS